MIHRQISLTPLDSWFFRDGRNHEELGGLEINSLPLPSQRTLYGALRAKLWDAVPEELRSGSLFDPTEAFNQQVLIGPATLRFTDTGPLYWPCPIDLIQFKTTKSKYVYSFAKWYQEKKQLNKRLQKKLKLQAEQAYLTTISDLGPVPFLHAKPNDDSDKRCAHQGQMLKSITLSKEWFTSDARGLKPDNFESLAMFIERELRLGIELKNRVAADGQLYVTQHIRYNEIGNKQQGRKQLKLVLIISFAEKAVCEAFEKSVSQQPVIRLGADGRGAYVDTSEVNNDLWPSLPDPAVSSEPSRAKGKGKNSKNNTNSSQQLMVTLLSPGTWQCDAGYGFLPGTESNIGGGVWQGSCSVRMDNHLEEKTSLDFTLLSALVDKPFYEGGWDMSGKGKPRATRMFYPAGSCFLIEANPESWSTLQGGFIGDLNHMGYGKIAIKPFKQGQ
ncbi:type III-B CRISPR module-associated Cmr3 family protein [Alteromonas gilva]|uniref:Type III-B CRISPR module-associated Cmr3 family protein n=1 Tax=Alteromonas gilva TaxID=2987522 RepID=A0ABT5L4V2_9ALTE|nr:type III-B CRISPR module-associated Cmr3 family protein [Alteromonas gilva]MDC8832070.1 type III-B CRISPR module-associated Cmr3 family protein [Alteromonas gilva]